MSALANALQVIASSPAARVKLATQAHILPRQVALARAGKPINAGAYLALCGAAGIDPVDGASRPIKTVSANVVWWLLSAALYITRGLRRLDQRAAAKAIGVSPSTVCRVECGKPVSIGNLVKVCAFIGVHPDGYTVPVGWPPDCVSRETPTETRCPDLENRHGDAARP
ncbi:MAG: helix-turn-helix domain-containing protein [Xanthobacteraceae bacterium]